MVDSAMFDVFLAHNSKDKPQVRQIASQLMRRGLNPWLDEEQMVGGDTTLDKIQEGISQSRCVAFFIYVSGKTPVKKTQLKLWLLTGDESELTT